MIKKSLPIIHVSVNRSQLINTVPISQFLNADAFDSEQQRKYLKLILL